MIDDSYGIETPIFGMIQSSGKTAAILFRGHSRLITCYSMAALYAEKRGHVMKVFINHASEEKPLIKKSS